MDYRLPYYMAYPMPVQYDDEKYVSYGGKEDFAVCGGRMRPNGLSGKCHL